MSESWDELERWANRKSVLGLKAIADDMPGVHSASKREVIDWLLANDRERLEESRHTEYRALGLG